MTGWCPTEILALDSAMARRASMSASRPATIRCRRRRSTTCWCGSARAGRTRGPAEGRRSVHLRPRLRGGAELERAGIPYEVMPGITAAQGCAASARVPLTHRGLATGVRYVTGHCRGERAARSRLGEPGRSRHHARRLYGAGQYRRDRRAADRARTAAATRRCLRSVKARRRASGDMCVARRACRGGARRRISTGRFCSSSAGSRRSPCERNER